MKALLVIKHNIEVNHVKYYLWKIHIHSAGFGGVIVGHKQFDDPQNAVRSAKRAAKKLGIKILNTRGSYGKN